MGQYLEIFIEESKENLQNMNQSLLDLENHHDNLDLVNEIFRIAHTLKGMSATMGFHKVSRLTHEMENVLQSLRNNEIDVSESIIDTLFECFDVLDGYINEISNTGEEGVMESNHLVEQLNEIINEGTDKKVQFVRKGQEDIHTDHEQENNAIDIEIEEYAKQTILTAMEEGYTCYKLKIDLKKDCMLKSARAFIIFNYLEKNAEVIHSNPPIEEIEDEQFENTLALIIISKLDQKIIQQEILNISEVEAVWIKEVNKQEVDAEFEEKEYQGVATTTVEDDKDFHKEKSSGKSKKNKIGRTVRVDIDRLDNLMNLVSELIIIKTRLEDIDESGKKNNMNEANETIEYLERITTSLHDAVMKVRMVSVERVFNRFPRMVRDLSKELGKEISLSMSGEETEVDRTVIDEIGDPLIHLIRNSLDHGIEEPDIRKKHGKAEIGSVNLKAYPDGNSVVIEVEDDGQGIDIEKVKMKAIEKGLITKEKSNNMDHQELVNLLFHPGFSTADKISDISGRGVGLDVVKTKIESLGGVIEVKTSQFKGSVFTIRLPLTLAIIQALLVKVGKEKYAIPLNSIKEIIAINPSKIKKIQKKEIVLYRNTTVPILRLHEILQVPSYDNHENEDLIIVVVKKGEKMAGLLIDNLIGQQEIVIKSLGKFLSNIKIIAGATILGNGQVALILDTNWLF